MGKETLFWSVLTGNEWDASFDESLKNKPVETCFLGKVFVVHTGRNAWHSTWNAGSQRQVHSTLSTAVGKALNVGKQGTTRTVSEVPVIVAAGFNRAVLIADMMNSAVPFRGYDVAVERNTLAGIRNSFSRTLGGRVRISYVSVITCPRAEVVPAQLPFYRWPYRSNGPSFFPPSPKAVDLTFTFDLIKRVNSHLSETGTKVEKQDNRIDRPLLHIVDNVVFSPSTGAESLALRDIRMNRWRVALALSKNTSDALYVSLTQCDPAIAEGNYGSKIKTAIEEWKTANKSRGKA